MLKPPPVKPKRIPRAHFLPTPTGAQYGKLSKPWRSPWARRATAVAVPALAALPLALAMPRGPITVGEALATMIVGFIVGLIAGFALRSRWAMLVAPFAFVAVY